jgi:hypothetical protein
MIRIGLLATSLLLANVLPLAAAGKIEGTWELVAMTPVAPADGDPHGMPNQKVYFTGDGKIYLIAPDARLTSETAVAQYEFDGKTRKVTLPDGSVRTNPVTIDGDTMRVSLETGETLTYRRLTGERAYDRELAPISVERIATKDQHYPADPTYDTADYSKQPPAQRIRGIWEVVRWSHTHGGDTPPYGFPNDKYVITDQQIAQIPANETKITLPSQTSKYQVKGDTLVVGDQTWKFSFDRWQRLVITRSDGELTLRLIQKATATIPEVPIKITLLDQE